MLKTFYAWQIGSPSLSMRCGMGPTEKMKYRVFSHWLLHHFLQAPGSPISIRSCNTCGSALQESSTRDWDFTYFELSLGWICVTKIEKTSCGVEEKRHSLYHVVHFSPHANWKWKPLTEERLIGCTWFWTLRTWSLILASFGLPHHGRTQTALWHPSFPLCIGSNSDLSQCWEGAWSQQAFQQSWPLFQMV